LIACRNAQLAKQSATTAIIKHDRMPVLLSEQADFQTWLTGSPD
jgi:putative SOS response-associated peptidase YedK